MCRTGVTVVVVYVMPNGDCVTFYDNKITMFGYIAVFSFHDCSRYCSTCIRRMHVCELPLE